MTVEAYQSEDARKSQTSHISHRFNKQSDRCVLRSKQLQHPAFCVFSLLFRQSYYVVSWFEILPTIHQTVQIAAPSEMVFDLARSIDLHVESTIQTGERVVGGRKTGLIELNESVTFEAVHFGIRQRLTSKITAFSRPVHFRDTMVQGAFHRFDHDHYFDSVGSDTIMRDVFDYTSPLGILGHVADAIILKRYLANLLRVRNEHIRRIAESGNVDRYLSM